MNGPPKHKRSHLSWLSVFLRAPKAWVKAIRSLYSTNVYLLMNYTNDPLYEEHAGAFVSCICSHLCHFKETDLSVLSLFCHRRSLNLDTVSCCISRDAVAAEGMTELSLSESLERPTFRRSCPRWLLLRRHFCPLRCGKRRAQKLPLYSGCCRRPSRPGRWTVLWKVLADREVAFYCLCLLLRAHSARLSPTDINIFFFFFFHLSHCCREVRGQCQLQICSELCLCSVTSSAEQWALLWCPVMLLISHWVDYKEIHSL